MSAVQPLEVVMMCQPAQSGRHGTRRPACASTHAPATLTMQYAGMWGSPMSALQRTTVLPSNRRPVAVQRTQRTETPAACSLCRSVARGPSAVARGDDAVAR